MNSSPVALITGGARGIGAGIAAGLARRGCDIAILDVVEADQAAAEVRAAGRGALPILADVTRAKAMFDRVEIETLGLVENMSYFVCPSCNDRHEIFSSGGGERIANGLAIPFLGRVPIETVVREAGDRGEPVVAAAPDSDRFGH